MFKRLLLVLMLSTIAPLVASAADDDYPKTIEVFRKAGESGAFFDSAYGYAVFPTIGKGGIGIGGAYGKGRVFEKGKYIGDCSMKQATIGFQFGGQAYSQIVFLQDARALKEFTGGNFEFGAEASAIAITASADAKAGTSGASAGASAGKHDAKTVGAYHKGMAVFTVAKGGLMYEATIGGQKFSYKPKAK
jgi:lipid-binding SYLF domain-containing protein